MKLKLFLHFAVVKQIILLTVNTLYVQFKPITARSGGSAGCKIYSGAPTVSQTTG